MGSVGNEIVGGHIDAYNDENNKTHYESKKLVGYSFIWKGHAMTFASALLETEYSLSDILHMTLELEVNSPIDLKQIAPLLQTFDLDIVKLEQLFQTPETTGTLYLQSQSMPSLNIEKKQLLSRFLEANPVLDLETFVITKWEAGVPLG